MPWANQRLPTTLRDESRREGGSGGYWKGEGMCQLEPAPASEELGVQFPGGMGSLTPFLYQIYTESTRVSEEPDKLSLPWF